MKWCVLLAVLAIPDVVLAQCVRDTDCKGDRICESGRCVAPGSAKEESPATSEPSTATTMGAGSDAAPAAETPPPLIAPPPPLRTEAIPAPVFTPKELQLNPGHIAELRSAGSLLDEKDAAVADHMARRGFTADEFVSAYRLTQALRLRDPRLVAYPREVVETVAIAQKLRLDEKDRLRLIKLHHDKGLPLTEAYNDELVGGNKTTLGGAIVVGIGAVAAVVGAVMFVNNDLYLEHCETWSDGWCTSGPSSKSRYDMFVGGMLMATGGGLALVAGVPTLAVGLERKSRRLADGALDGEGPIKVSTNAADQEPARVQFLSAGAFPTRSGMGVGATFGF